MISTWPPVIGNKSGGGVLLTNIKRYPAHLHTISVLVFTLEEEIQFKITSHFIISAVNFVCTLVISYLLVLHN